MKVRKIQLEDMAQFEQIGMEVNSKPTLNLQQWLDAGRKKLERCLLMPLKWLLKGL